MCVVYVECMIKIVALIFLDSFSAVRLSSILQSVGLSPASLSQSGNVSLRTLASTALTLGIKDATTSRYDQLPLTILP